MQMQMQMSEPLPFTQCKTITSTEVESLPQGDWIMEPKIDGWRMQFEVTPNDVQAWTRGNKPATGKMPMVEEYLKALTLGRHGFVLDGEAVYIDPETGIPNYRYSASCLGSGVDVCVDKQKAQGYLTYCVFDILVMDGHDVRGKSLEARKSLMHRFLGEGMRPNVKMIMGDEPSFEQHSQNFAQYLEGSVVKQLSSPYAGKRHKSWLKWKEIETVDAKIIGYKEGQGKFLGLIGAIRFQAPDGTIGYCSGMDDSTRIWISDRRQSLIGKTIEIKHFGKMKDGFRHPQFQRFREDLI